MGADVGGGGKGGSNVLPTAKQALNPFEAAGVAPIVRGAKVLRTGRDDKGRRGADALAMSFLPTANTNESLLG